MVKYIYAILLSLCIAAKGFIAIKTEYKLDKKPSEDYGILQTPQLYNHIDSLITHVFRYKHDKNSVSTTNPFPPLLFDGKLVDMEFLKGMSLSAIESIDIYEPGIEAMVIFGTSGRNGAIILTSKENEAVEKDGD